MNKLIDNIQYELKKVLGVNVQITSFRNVGGGCINNSIILITDKGKFFVKYNQADKYPGMMESEAAGLKSLVKTGKLKIPDVISFCVRGNIQFLILEYIKQGEGTDNFWKIFGEGLAELHSCHKDVFGLESNNYIGSLKQSNKQHEDWSNFFIEERLRPQIDLAIENNAITNDLIDSFEKLFIKIKDIFPLEKPSLLHGDLWSGNFMITEKGWACIYDPAVYYGHREMDIGMTRLFGGFDKRFYDAYNKVYAMEKGWETRIELCNLYPLMVHVNLFGGSYISQVKEILKSFI